MIHSALTGPCMNKRTSISYIVRWMDSRYGKSSKGISSKYSATQMCKHKVKETFVSDLKLIKETVVITEAEISWDE